MSSKRSPQTAAKRAREQAVREKRELKAAKKQAAIYARKNPESVLPEGEDSVDDGSLETGESPDGETVDTPVSLDQPASANGNAVPPATEL